MTFIHSILELKEKLDAILNMCHHWLSLIACAQRLSWKTNLIFLKNQLAFIWNPRYFDYQLGLFLHYNNQDQAEVEEEEWPWKELIYLTIWEEFAPVKVRKNLRIKNVEAQKKVGLQNRVNSSRKTWQNQIKSHTNLVWRSVLIHQTIILKIA